jgi:chemotaxis protein methyltransferase CheR
MAVQKTREFVFTDQDFDHIRTLVNQHTGIALAEGKREMVYSRLSRRLRQLQLERFGDYCARLEAGDTNELGEFVNAVTTNLTAFFREMHHFDYLRATLFPTLLQDKARRQRLRIWSAGCSTGEEPYSIAMVVRELFADTSGWDIKLLATDIDSQVLATAQQGIYHAERVHGISPERLRCWFHKGTGSNADRVRVTSELQALIAFRQLNLMQAWPMRGPFDVIFCRNVVIYFDKATQRRLFDRFADLLAPHGLLFVGHSESLFNVSDRFELLGKTIYRRQR